MAVAPKPARLNGMEYSHCKALFMMGSSKIECLFDSLDINSEEKQYTDNYANSDRHVSWTEGAIKAPSCTVKMKMSQLNVLRKASPGGQLVANGPEDSTFVFSNGIEKNCVATVSGMMYTKVTETSGDNSEATVDFVCDRITVKFP